MSSFIIDILEKYSIELYVFINEYIYIILDVFLSVPNMTIFVFVFEN